jgi:hypothetical protein
MSSIDIFKLFLPVFKVLRHFECIGYAEIEKDMVQALLNTHKNLRGLGLM